MGQTSIPVCPTGVSRGWQMDVNGKRTDTTVLVVDDVAASRYAMSAVLRRAGHQVVPVASGSEALVELDVRLRKGTLPDVALVDVDLPDMSGFELCRRSRPGPTWPACPSCTSRPPPWTRGIAAEASTWAARRI